MNFTTENQNVWGAGTGDSPSGNRLDFFHDTWSESGSKGDIRTFAGQDFGASITGSTSGEIGLGAQFKGFDNGGVSVNYPVDVTLSWPAANSFRPGQTISIGSSLVVKPDASMTVANAGGDIDLLGTFAFSASASGKVCFFGCESESLVPSISIPKQSGTIFSLTDLVETCEFALDQRGTGAKMIAPTSGCVITEADAYLARLPFTGKVGVPNIAFTTTLESDGTLKASGTHHDFMNLQVDLNRAIEKVAGVSLGVSLPPLVSGVSAEAYALDSKANFSISQSQEVRFSPTIQATLRLPSTGPAVQYTVETPAGAVVSSGTGRTIVWDVGNTVDIVVPADLNPGDVLNATPTFAVKQTANFSNTVTTTVTSDVTAKALGAEVSTDGAVVIPSYEITPEVCTPLGCVPPVTSPEVKAPSIRVALGPLWEETLAAATLTDRSLFDENRAPWSLGSITNSPAGSGTDILLDPEYYPVISLSVPDPLNEGDDSVGFTLSDGDLDPLVWTLDWGDGTVMTGTGDPGGQSFTGLHAYSDNGTYSMRLTVDDGHEPSVATRIMQVANVEPTVDVGPDTAIYSGQSLALSGSFTDPSPVDTHSATVDWGDGSPVETVTVTQGQGTGTMVASHRYLEARIYTVELCVTDDDGGTGCDQLDVDVLRLPVAMNAKPGSPENQINPRSLIPVAMLTTLAGEYGLPEPFDATQIDVATVLFGPLALLKAGGGTESHDRGHIEDALELDEVTLDGDLDLVLHFEAGASSLTETTAQVCIWGITVGGVWFEACDSIRVVPESTGPPADGGGGGGGREKDKP